MLTEMTTDTTFQVLEKALDGSSHRHRVLANNIANVNTPGFKRTDISFQEDLRKALDCAKSCRPGYREESRFRNCDYAGSGHWQGANPPGSGCSAGKSRFAGEQSTFCFQANRSNPAHFEFGVPTLTDMEPRLNKFLHLQYRNDASSVDIDREVGELTKNSLYYNAIARRISGKLGMLNTIITKGGQA